MEMCREYEILVCGNTTENMFDYGEIISNLSEKIKKLTTLIMEYNWDSGKANVDILFIWL